MDSSEQRRKRKRTSPTFLLFPYFHHFSSSSKSLLSLRCFVLCFGFLTFVYLLSVTVHMEKYSSAFKPVLFLSSLSLLSSYATSSSAHNRVHDFGDFHLPFRVEGRVLLPDHVLLLVSSVENSGLGVKTGELECVYRKRNESFGGRNGGFVKQNVISVDDCDEFSFIVRCPLPPVNYSAVVNLHRHGRIGIDVSGENGGLMGNQTVNSWDNVAYAATLDGDTAVVFVKGLNLRPARKSDPRLFSCHFGLEKWGRNGRFMLRTKAVSAAQEVVRCLVPRSIWENPEKAAQGIRVTVGVRPRVHAGANGRVVLPSVAKIYNPFPDERKRNKGKYVLCVCTMVWNQAFALREWIMYHAWLGVERWFIYDNNSDDGIKEVIEELDLEDYNVTRHVWPWIKTQEAGFSHCALRAKDECKWVSFMDVDEFFYFPYSTPRHKLHRMHGYAGQKSLQSLVANFTSSSSKIAEIRTACRSFGPSGLNSPPSRGVTVGYTCRLQSPERHKSIIRPDALDTTLLNVVHHFHSRKGFRYLNLPQSTAVINHYKYQVWDVFKAKFYRRVATYVADWQENQNEGSRDRAPGLGTEAIEPPDWHLRFCEVWDTGLRDFVLANLADPSTGLLPWKKSPL